MPAQATLRLWVDAQLPPAVTMWLARTGVELTHVQDLNLLRAPDPEIFVAARQAGVVVMTKDVDFVQLLERHGPPPQVIWATCGNLPNRDLRPLLLGAWPRVEALLRAGEALVEIVGPRTAG